MDRGVGLVARLIRPQVQEQAEDFSGAPPDYEGRIVLDPTLLDMARLKAALETGVFELTNSRVHQTWSYTTSEPPCTVPQFFCVSSAVWLEVPIAQPISRRSVGGIFNGLR